MTKLKMYIFVVLAGCLMLAGCTAEPTKQSEYTLQIGKVQYTVSEKLLESIPWETGEVTEVPEEPPFPASRHYQKDQLSLLTFVIDDARGTGEQIYSIITTREGKTPRNIGIGDSLDVLKSAYPELLYHNAAQGNGTELAEYTRLYSYAPEDGTNYYINFYLKDKKVTMIEIANALDAPKTWDQWDLILGKENLFCEVLSDKPGQSHVQYFYAREDGTEEVFLDIQNAWPQSLDLDGDGVTELIVQYMEQNQYTNVGIYYRNEDQVKYLDVKETLAAEGMNVRNAIVAEKAANEQSQYQYYITVSAAREDGKKLEAKYGLQTGKLIAIE